MANRKSAARQALNDMQECKLDVSFFMSSIKKYHHLNSEIGIERYETKKTIEVKVSVVVNYMPPEVYVPAPRKTRYINPDGTISMYPQDRWDND